MSDPNTAYGQHQQQYTQYGAQPQDGQNGRVDPRQQFIVNKEKIFHKQWRNFQFHFIYTI